MGEDTSNLQEVADTKQGEEGDHGTDDGRALDPELVLVPEQEQERGDVGDELVGAVVEDNVQGVEVGNDHTRRAGSSQTEGDHSFHIDSEEVEVRTWQADQVVGCDNDVKDVAAAAAAAVAAQCARMNNSHDGRTDYGQRVVVSGKSG